jgi:hypothetical protein
VRSAAAALGTALTLVATAGCAFGVADRAVDPVSRIAVFPSARTTGVPTGMQLRRTGDLLVSAGGTVLDGLDVAGCITVAADDVTIRRSRVRGIGRCGGGFQIATGYRQHGILVEDVEIDGMGRADGAGICCSGFTVRRADIHSVGGAGVHAKNDVVVEDSYVHDLATAPGVHVDAVITNGDARSIVVRRNRLENPHSQTSVVALFPDFGPLRDVLVADNLLVGGGYTVYAGAGEGSRPDNVRFVGNRFSRRFFGRGGYWGPVTAWTREVGWDRNVWDDSGETVQPAG